MCLYIVISAKVTKPRNLVLINNDIKPNGASLNSPVPWVMKFIIMK